MVARVTGTLWRAKGSRMVAWNTAVAMRVVSTDVEVDVGEPPVVLVDKKRITLPKYKGGRSLGGGGKLAYTSNGAGSDQPRCRRQPPDPRGHLY
jgi:hypothetical protein